MINKQIWFPGPLSLDNMVGETRSGLSSVFNIQCSKCGKINNVHTSKHHRTGSRGPKASDINSRAVLGSLHIGVGQTQLNNFLATLNVPTMNSQLFKMREREIGNSIEKVAKASCEVYLEQEKENAEKSNNLGEVDSMPGIAVSYDMGWTKRGKGHNSLTGHGASMGLKTGKVLSYATRCKACRVCESSKKSGKVAKTHDCRKNHVGSSKSMERDVAVELWTNALDSGTHFSTYVGDDDSTTIADILSKVPYKVEKWSDTIHTKRSLTTRLYNLKDRFKNPNCSTLSNKVISYYAKCFSYAVTQNAGNPELLKSGINSIVPHSFGEHSSCNISWCGFKKCPEGYKHTELPNGKSLHGEPLKNALTNIFSEYATDIVVKKLSPCANSQRNESLNNTIATKNPKTRYYGGSVSNDFRVACGVAQRNLGYGYVSTALEVLNIEPGYFCTSHEDLMDKKVFSDRNRKATKNFKYRRNQLRGQKSSQNSQKEAKEGKTYETAVALNLDTSVNQPTPRTHTHIEHLLENISDNELHEYEKLVPSYYAQPDLPKLTYDPNQTYTFVVFDTETTCTGKNAELCQLYAIHENQVFSKYILPTGNVSTGASRVNKLSVQNINGIRKLLKENQPVETVSLDKALQEFHTFLSQVKCSTQKESCIVLIGHNSSTFDTPILLRRSDENFRSKLSNLNVYFGDSQILVKHLLKDKHPALQLSESASCKSNQSALYSHLFKEEFEAHDALEDVKALRKILFHSALQMNKEKLVNYSGVISVEQAIASMSYMDRRHEILQTFSGRLFDPRDDNGAIKQSMAQKIAGSGLSYSHLKELYLKFGTKGLLAILSMPPSQSTATKPRVTRTKRILDAIANHFQEAFPKEE